MVFLLDETYHQKWVPQFLIFQTLLYHSYWYGYFTIGIHNTWNITINFKILYPGLVQRLFFLAEDWKFRPHSLHLRDVFQKASSGSPLSATTGYMSKTCGISRDYIE